MFAIPGVMLIINILLNAANLDVALVVPVYLKQAIVYFALAYAFLRGYEGQGFTVFLMSAVWLLANILIWSGVTNSILMWLLLLAQLFLLYRFFTHEEIRFAGSGGSAWTYAAVWIVFIFGAARLLMVFSGGITIAQVPLWGLGVLLISLGYIIRPIEEGWSAPLQVVGALLTVISGLTASGLALQLMP